MERVLLSKLAAKHKLMTIVVVVAQNLKKKTSLFSAEIQFLAVDLFRLYFSPSRRIWLFPLNVAENNDLKNARMPPYKKHPIGRISYSKEDSILQLMGRGIFQMLRWPFQALGNELGEFLMLRLSYVTFSWTYAIMHSWNCASIGRNNWWLSIRRCSV